MAKNSILQIIIASVLITLLAGCASLKPLPEGVILLRGVDPNRFESPLWSPDGSKIVGGRVWRPMPDIAGFGSRPGSEMFLVDVFTGDVQILLKEDRSYFWPIGWTPEGQNVIINSDSSSFGSGCFELDLSEELTEPISEELCQHGFSSDHKKSANFQWKYPYEELKLIITDKQSGQEEVVYSISTKGVWFANSSIPEWSPDGKKIVFSLGLQMERDNPADTEIYIFDVETHNIERFLGDPVYFDNFPVFSPDGKFISHYFMRFAESGIERGVSVTRVDKSCQWRLPYGGGFDWSPDSTKIVVSADDGVYIVDLLEYLGESFVTGVGCP